MNSYIPLLEVHRFQVIITFAPSASKPIGSKPSASSVDASLAELQLCLAIHQITGWAVCAKWSLL
jgi:hypothetical protein